MVLKIIKKEAPFELPPLVCTIYGAPGVGKTTLAATASKPLLFAFDPGWYRSERARARWEDGDLVPVRCERWADVVNVTAEDVADYDTIIVDTVGQAIDLLKLDRILPKYGKGGGMNQNAWGKLKEEFADWVKRLRRTGKQIVFVAHLAEESRGEDGKVAERLVAQGASRQMIHESSDIMGRLDINDAGSRVIDFRPLARSYGKDGGGIGSRPIDGKMKRDDLALADMMAFARENMAKALGENILSNPRPEYRRQEDKPLTPAEPAVATAVPQVDASMSEAQIDREAKRAAFTAQIQTLREMGDMKGEAAQELHRKATAAGFTYDKEQDAYV